MSDTNLEVAVIMGSDSDLPVVEAAFPIFDKFGINYTKNVMSAHRTPHDVIEFIKNSENNGCKVFIVNFCIKGDKVLKKIRLREKYFVKKKFCVMLE